MKFADKYEILEMVTSGRVSTFLARERISQEPVVVYTFECAGTGAGELSTASIIARFCSLAPNPPGSIVKAGFDEASSSAFITTKMPESAALQAWVGAYQAFIGAKPVAPAGVAVPPAKRAGPHGDETAELSASEVRSVMARSGPLPKQPPVENLSEDMGSGTAAFSLSSPVPASSPSAGELTRLFNEVNAFQPVQSGKPPVAPPASKPRNAADAVFGERLGGSPLGGERFPPQPVAPAPVEPSPGAFTREFMGLPTEKAPAPRQPSPTAPTVPPENQPGAFTREFMAVSQEGFRSPDKTNVPSAKNSAPPQATSFDSIFGPPSPPASSSADNQKAGAGEFTSFFRDPFESPGAPQKPIEIPDLRNAAPSKPPAGDFTRMFGREDIGREEPALLPSLAPEPPAASPGSFTQMFGEVPAARKSPGTQLGEATLGTSPNIRPTFLESSGVPAAPLEPARAATPAPPAMDPFFSRTSTPVAPPASPSFMNRAGSSEATDVFRIPGGDAAPMEPVPSGPSEFTVFLSRSQINASMAPEPSPPSAPPSFAPPPPPPGPFHFPAPPPPPAAPAMKFPRAPAMPVVPPAPAAAPKLASFWPLIVVLTVLIAIGALLVMYFALKH